MSARDPAAGPTSSLLTQAARSLRRSPTFAILAVCTLGLAIGLNMAIFSVVYGVLLPLDLPRADRLFTVWEEPAGQEEEDSRSSTSRGAFIDWRERNHSFEHLAAYITIPADLTGGELAENVPGAVVSSEFFEVLGVQPALGRGFLREEETTGRQQVAILSHDLWQRRYGGDRSIVGETIRVNGNVHTVVGILPPGFRAPLIPRTELWAVLPLDPPPEDRGHSYVRVIGRLAEGVSASQAARDMRRIASELSAEYPDSLSGVGASIEPLLETVVGSSRRLLLLLLVAVSLVLLAACANVASLMTSRMAARRQEIALRMALGAKRRQLSRHVLIECLLIALCGAVLAVVVGLWGVRLVRSLAPPELPRIESIRLDGTTLGYALVLTVAAALLAGSLPAARTWWRQPAQVLREVFGYAAIGSGDRRWRGVLIVGEIALGLVLLIGTGLLLRTLINLSAIDPGFRTEGVVGGRVVLAPTSFPSTGDLASFVSELDLRLNALQEFEAAGLVSTPPLTAGHVPIEMVSEDAMARNRAQPALVRAVTPGFFAVFGLKALRGRAIDRRDALDSDPVAVVDRRFAERFFAGRDAIGRRVRFADEDRGTSWYRIVGVVADIRGLSLDRPPEPEIYLPAAQWPARQMSLVARTGRSADSAFELSAEPRRRHIPVWWSRISGPWNSGSRVPSRCGVSSRS